MRFLCSQPNNSFHIAFIIAPPSLDSVMPQDSSSKDYTIDSTGTNSQVSRISFWNRNLDREPDTSGRFFSSSIEIPNSWRQSRESQSDLHRDAFSFPVRDSADDVVKLSGDRRQADKIVSLSCRAIITAAATTATTRTRITTPTSTYFCHLHGWSPS